MLVRNELGFEYYIRPENICYAGGHENGSYFITFIGDSDIYVDKESYTRVVEWLERGVLFVGEYEPPEMSEGARRMYERLMEGLDEDCDE